MYNRYGKDMELDILRLGLEKNALATAVNFETIEKRQQLEIEALVKSISELNEFVLLNARSLEDEFRRETQNALKRSKTLAKEDKQRELPKVRMTVRLTRFHTVEISWNKIKYLNNKRNAEGPRMITDYLKRPLKSYEYTPSIFADEPQWVKELGPKLEKKLGILRQQTALLSNIRENLFRLSRLTHNYGDINRLDHRDQNMSDLALLDELMGSEDPGHQSDSQDQTKQWVTTSAKCQSWMRDRVDSVMESLN